MKNVVESFDVVVKFQNGEVYKVVHCELYTLGTSWYYSGFNGSRLGQEKYLRKFVRADRRNQQAFANGTNYVTKNSWGVCWHHGQYNNPASNLNGKKFS